MALAVVFLGSVSGCATLNKAQRADYLERENRDLRAQLDKLMEQRDTALDRARRDLTSAFQKELGEYKAKLEMTERGLVLTFLAEVFFNSGQAEIRTQGKEILDKVAKVLKDDVPDSLVAVEGHTDSEPIVRSGWKSNWELSTARALAVLHYFIDQDGITPERLSAVGYGEYHPVASNETAEGKKKNRRVEIVILPSQMKKVKAQES
ncbi:MAG: OmpA family protein [Deltaproteobacteria bacterium]